MPLSTKKRAQQRIIKPKLDGKVKSKAKAKTSSKTNSKTKSNTNATKRATSSAQAPNAAWESIYKTIARIPVGRVTTYGTVAHLAGLPRRARLVGTALRGLPATHTVPWQRVIGAGGRLAFPESSDAYAKQRRLLAREGVKMIGARIDMERYGWPRESKSLDEMLWGRD